MTRSLGSSKHIAHLYCAIACIYFAKHLSQKSNRFANVARWLFVKYDSWLVITGSRYDASYALIIGMLTWLQFALITKYHNSARFNRFDFDDVEVLGAVGIEKNNIASRGDVA